MTQTGGEGEGSTFEGCLCFYSLVTTLTAHVDILFNIGHCTYVHRHILR